MSKKSKPLVPKPKLISGGFFGDSFSGYLTADRANAGISLWWTITWPFKAIIGMVRRLK